MKIKITHPLWTHLPAISAFIILIVYLITAGPLPAESPVHFGLGGETDKLGSPWSVFGITIGLSVFFIILSVFFDELWARQEKAKEFNWISLLDEIIVGAMVGISIGYLITIRNSAFPFNYPWNYFLPLCGGATVLGLIVEIMRPYRPFARQLVFEKSKTMRDELTRQLADKSSFVFWDYQNPFYVTLLTTVLPLGMMVAAVLSWFSQPSASLLLVFVAIVLLIPHGGQRTLVTLHCITVRWGITGIQVLRLKISGIAKVERHEFAPLKDFGGYGIRLNREMKAYFLRGTSGIKIIMNDGKKYLVGSDNPERLLTVLQVLTEIPK
ncbi:hypothetical protein ACFLVZ_03240 [Chloroflexota bacterium]